MSNSWGRNNQVTRNGSSRSVLPLVLIVLLAGLIAYGWFARQSLLSNIETLQAQTASLSLELSKAKADLDTANRAAAEAGQIVEPSTDALESALDALRTTEIPNLNRILEQRNADIARLERQIDTERAARAQSEETGSAVGSRRTAQIEAATKALADLQARLNDVFGRNAELSRQADRLTTQLDEASTERSVLQKAISDGDRTRRAEAQKHADDMSRLRKTLAQAQATITDLNAKLTAQSTALSRQRPEPAAETNPSASSPGTATARDAVVVEKALGNTRNLGLLDAGQIDILREKLNSGACVTASLQAVLKRVPIVLMRNLMRDLNADC